MEDLVIDEKTYSVRFKGFHSAMEVCKSNGGKVEFFPLNYHDKMMTLKENLISTPGGLILSHKNFSMQVLNICCPALLPNEYDYYSELALWWANGQNRNEAAALKHSITLRPWKNRERITALINNISEDDLFDIAGYLDEMIRRSVEKIFPEVEIDDIDSGISFKLSEDVINLNIPENAFHKSIKDKNVSKIYAEQTLKICSSLGWTPSQVYETCAVETDTILELLEFVMPAEEKKKKDPGLESYPDAVVLQFEDD